MCGWTGKGSLAARPVRWTIRKNHAVVTGVPASVTNTYGLCPCKGRNAKRMDAFDPALGPVDVQSAMPKVDLRPAKLTKLLSPEPMAICNQDALIMRLRAKPTFEVARQSRPRSKFTFEEYGQRCSPSGTSWALPSPCVFV